MKFLFLSLALLTSSAAGATELRCERIGMSLDNMYLTEHSLLEGVLFLANGKTQNYGFRHRLWNVENGYLLKQVGIQASEAGELTCTQYTTNPISISCTAGLVNYPSFIKLAQTEEYRMVLEMQTIHGSTYTWFNPGECSIK